MLFKRLLRLVAYKPKYVYVLVTIHSGTSVILGVWRQEPSNEERAIEYSKYLKEQVEPYEIYRWTRVEKWQLK